MKRKKQIIFRQQNDQRVEILLKYETFGKDKNIQKEKIIGQIFSPSGSGGIYTNAIQVCGLDEAFDLHGCAVFAKPKVRIEDENRFEKRFFHDEKGKLIMQQVKDIQMYFDEDTQHHISEDTDHCYNCYNNPCTCENKGGYTVKTSKDLKDKLKIVKREKPKSEIESIEKLKDVSFKLAEEIPEETKKEHKFDLTYKGMVAIETIAIDNKKSKLKLIMVKDLKEYFFSKGKFKQIVKAE